MKRTIKKIIAPVLALLILIGAVAVSPAIALAVRNGDYWYEVLQSGTIEITNYRGDETDLVIPSKIDGYKVTNIGDYAFDYNYDLVSVTIPDGVINIGNYAFRNCKNLEDIVIPDSVINISGNAFKNTAWYDNQHRGLIYAGKVLYKYTGYEPDGISITIEEGTKGIASYAFNDCDDITSITIPESVEHIGAYAFNSCGSLKDIKLPQSITKISYGTFYGCWSLEDITIPEGVTSIGYDAFAWCKGLKSVVISDGVISIGDFAFSECTGLESVTIPDSVTSIGDHAFRRCLNLTEITLPNSVTTIGEDAFYNCDSLTTVTISDGVTNIGEAAFIYCDNLKEITIGKGVTSIGNKAFADCPKLENIFVSADNSVYADADGVLYNKNTMELINYPAGRKTTEYTVFDGAKSISDEAFCDNDIIITITLPDSFTDIGEKVFHNTKNLENINVSENNSKFISVDGVVYSKDLTEIVRFPEGKKDTEYTILDGVTKISAYTFSKCENLENITIPDSVEYAGLYAFDKTAWYENLPEGMVYAGKAAYKYKANMLDIINNVVLEEGTKSISDQAFAFLSRLSKVTIPDSVTYIGKDAFTYCSGLSDITIPNSVTTIDDYAFSNCDRFKNIIIPNSVTSIGEGAFEKCDNLKSIYLPDSITRIEAYTFAGCDALEDFVIPRNVTSIGTLAFEGCFDFGNVKIPETVTDIEDYAFGYYKTSIGLGRYFQDFSISGYAGTAAEKYAKANDFEFIELFKYYGDADNDGTVTVKDATQIQMYLADFINKFGIDLTVSDVNNDDDINISDATMIQMYLADFETNTDIGKVFETKPDIEPTAPDTEPTAPDTEPTTQPETQETTGKVEFPEYTEPYTGW